MIEMLALIEEGAPGLWHAMSSPVRTLGSWVLIPMKAQMFMLGSGLMRV
jgi:hypothetical protein